MGQMRKMTPLFALAIVLGVVAGMNLVAPPLAQAQATISTGSIQGTILDPKGAVVASAKVTITNKGTGQRITPEVTSAGEYNSGPLIPGDYVLRVEASGFKTVEKTLTVQLGVIASGNVTLELGSETIVINVEASAITVNLQQAIVQDVLTVQQIEQLPVDGRNFLDLAQLAPGVQIQDGSTFDPTKNGFSSISFGGRAGRTARIEVDGLDVSDETVGTTTQNIPVSAIQEFNVSQSSLDLSTELTSSGAVNILTRSGANDIHGQLFYYGRSNRSAARIAPKELDFGRNQFGGNFGGHLIRDKLFYFVDVERTTQTLQNPVTLTDPFGSLSGSFNSPFRETEYVGKFDWNIKGSWKVFYRFSYDQNLSVRGFNPGVYQPFANVDHTPVHAIGTDFTSGRFTHSFRVGYMKFRNAIADASQGVLNPAAGIALIISPSSVDLTCLGGGEAFCSGANILAPQATLQSNKQGKYDGSFTFGSHILRYGIGVNRILGGGFAKFFGLAPAVDSQLTSDTELAADSGPFPGKRNNPLNYPAQNVLLGNGQGFFTEMPQFGFPAGGQFDTRFTWYVGDSWKATHRLTISYGVHYVRDTGRSDSDLAAIPELEQFGPGLGRRVHQPNKNFSPQLGIAWDPFGKGKTVIRAGTGIFYENAVFNNVLFDRPGRLQKGLFFGTGLACIFSSALPPVNYWPAGQTLPSAPAFCGQPIGNVVNDIAAFQQQYQAAVLAAGPQSNINFVGNTLAEGGNSTGDQLIAPNYRSPYSFQVNVGIQHQFGRGTVLTADYVRNVGLHYLLGIDVNHIGAARTLNVANAQAAINATNAQFKDALANPCAAGSAGINCAIAAGATIADYAGNGLDSGVALSGGFPCPTCAFPGLNPNLGENQILFPIGRSVYNGMLVSLKSNLQNPLRGVRAMNLVVSYALARFKSQAADQDFINNSLDFDNPRRFFGPNGLDRTHNLGVGAVMDFPWATRVGITTHWATAIPITLFLPNSGLPGEIFRTDVTGDGRVADPVPGTNIGSFGRDVTASDINNLISTYNTTAAGQLTPAGQALVSAGLFTQSQLVQLGAVTPTLAKAPKGQVGVSPRFTFDMYVSWVLRVNKLFHGLSERIVVEPQVALFNVFNFQNFDPGGNVLSGTLNGLPGSANGTARGDRTNLVSPGSASGVNWGGVPRQWQFGIKLTF